MAGWDSYLATMKTTKVYSYKVKITIFFIQLCININLIDNTQASLRIGIPQIFLRRRLVICVIQKYS